MSAQGRDDIARGDDSSLSAGDALHSFRTTCPHCGERITLLFDLSAGSQQFVEDCEICCKPIQIRFRVEAGFLTDVEMHASD